MPKLRLQITQSLDGYVAGPDQSVEHPLGVGGEELHDWALELKAWREPHGREGGEVNESTPVMEAMTENVGASIMGRNMFGGGPGPWSEDEPWNGWWGENPPFHTPVFVLTHHPRADLVLADTTFHFVTDGIESAYRQAMDAAGGKDVTIGGGAQTAQQFLTAGLLDVISISIAPRILGGGERLFANVPAGIELKPVGTIAAPGVTHLRYEVVRSA